MKTFRIKNKVETKIGVKTNAFSDAKAILWNTRRRFA
jgi:hypothetical protein